MVLLNAGLSDDQTEGEASGEARMREIEEPGMIEGFQEPGVECVERCGVGETGWSVTEADNVQRNRRENLKPGSRLDPPGQLLGHCDLGAEELLQAVHAVGTDQTALGGTRPS